MGLQTNGWAAAFARGFFGSFLMGPRQVFPEGTCVNNEYVIMFKRGAFDLGTSIVPVAIKYNKVFVDGFWNSKKQTFLQHLFTLMTSWAVVADIWYMVSFTGLSFS